MNNEIVIVLDREANEKFINSKIVNLESAKKLTKDGFTLWHFNTTFSNKKKLVDFITKEISSEEYRCVIVDDTEMSVEIYGDLFGSEPFNPWPILTIEYEV